MAYSAFEQKQIPNASTTVQGAVQEATQAEYDAGVDVGSTGARLFVKPSFVGRSISVPAYEAISKGDIVGISHYTPTDITVYNNTAAYNTLESTVSNTTWIAQRFTVPGTYAKAATARIYALHAYLTTNTANGFTMRLRTTLTGADLWSQSFTNNYATAMTMHNMGNPESYLVPGSTYFLIISENSGTDTALGWGYSNTDATPPTGGESWVSTDSGANWTEQTDRNYIIRYDMTVNGSLGHYHAYKASAAALNNRFGFAGVALNDAAEDEQVAISSSLSVALTGLTPGEDYYLSNTNGLVSTTPGTITLWLGHATSDIQLIRPSSFLASDTIGSANSAGTWHIAGFIVPQSASSGSFNWYNRVPPGANWGSRGSYTVGSGVDNPSGHVVGVGENWSSNQACGFKPFIAID
jgi:hypothetical protein